MRLEMTKQEQQVLAETLAASLTRLSDEICHTDSYDYRQQLKDRKQILIKLSDKLH